MSADAAADAKRDARYQKKYGISLVEYNRLLELQGGRCYICRCQPRKFRLAVDHDHAREKVAGSRRSIRGLLCMTCNRHVLGPRITLDALRRAVEYVETLPAQSVLS